MSVTQRVLLLVPLSALASVLVAQERKSDVPATDELRKTIREASTPFEAGRAYRKFFTRVKTSGLEKLMDDQDTGIALYAAWEMSKKPPNRKSPNPHRFLGFLEGRTQLVIPLRWEVEIVRSSLQRWETERERALDEYLPTCPFMRRSEKDEPVGFIFTYAKYKDSEIGLGLPLDTAVKKVNDKISIRKDGGEVVVTPELFERWSTPFGLCTVTIGPEIAIIAIHDAAACPFPIIAVDKRTGRQLWTQNLWALGPKLEMGNSHHELAIVHIGNVIGVFGVCNWVCYLEALDARTGKVLFRFVDNYWYQE